MHDIEHEATALGDRMRCQFEPDPDPMKKGFEIGGKFRNDPIGSEAPRGKSRGQRKSARDGKPFTPTETHQKNQLMRQFMKNPEGVAGNSEAYISAPCWCECGRLVIRDGKCARCLEAVAA